MYYICFILGEVFDRSPKRFDVLIRVWFRCQRKATYYYIVSIRLYYILQTENRNEGNRNFGIHYFNIKRNVSKLCYNNFRCYTAVVVPTYFVPITDTIIYWQAHKWLSPIIFLNNSKRFILIIGFFHAHWTIHIFVHSLRLTEDTYHWPYCYLNTISNTNLLVSL